MKHLMRTVIDHQIRLHGLRSAPASLLALLVGFAVSAHSTRGELLNLYPFNNPCEFDHCACSSNGPPGCVFMYPSPCDCQSWRPWFSNSPTNQFDPTLDSADVSLSGSLRQTYIWSDNFGQGMTWINLTNRVNLAHYEYCGLDLRIEPGSTCQTNPDGTAGFGQFLLTSVTLRTNADLSTSEVWGGVFQAAPLLENIGQWMTYSGSPVPDQTNVVAFILILQGVGWTNDPALGYGHTTLNIDNLRAFTPPPSVGISTPSASQVNIRIFGFHGQKLLLQASPDLWQWQTVATNTLASNTWDYAESIGVTPTKFYRALEGSAP